MSQQTEAFNQEIAAIKSSAFDMNAKLNAENNQLANQVKQLNSFIGQICNAMGVKGEIKPESLVAKIAALNKNE